MLIKKIFNFLIIALLLTSCAFKEDNLKSSKYNNDVIVNVAFSISKINPLSYDTDLQRILPNIFESLVKFDNLMRISPAIAVSWGNIDDYTWEFKIRDDVFFHDGTKLTMKDIVDTLEFVKSKDFLSTHVYASNIDSIKVEGNRLIIKTIKKDPIFLQKLTNIYIIKSSDLTSKNVWIGNGKYKIKSIDNEKIHLEIFDKYYNYTDQSYKNIKIFFVEDRNKRYENIINNKATLLADVPLDFVSDIEELILKGKLKDIEIIESSSIDSLFLVFNTYFDNKNFLASKDLRLLISLLIDKNKIVDFIGQRFILPSYQFINSNVVGYDPLYEKELANKTNFISFEEGKERLKKILGKDMLLILSLGSTYSMSVLAQNIQQQLFKYDIQLDLKNLKEEDLEKSIKNKDFNMYILGWRFGLLDATDFLYTLLRYSGLPESDDIYKEVDNIAQIMNIDERITKIKLLIKRLLNDYVVGVPLFEPKNVYIKNKNFDWLPYPNNALIF